MFLCQRRNLVGSTLVEGMMAAGICAIFLGSLFAMNTSSMATIKMSRQSAAASQVLQQRVESMRIANWHQITDANWLKNNVLNSDVPGASDIKGLSESLMLIPYDSATSGNTQLTRAAGRTTVVNSIPLLAENAIKLIWTLNYIGVPNDRPMTRQTVAIMAKGGVAK